MSSMKGPPEASGHDSKVRPGGLVGWLVVSSCVQLQAYRHKLGELYLIQIEVVSCGYVAERGGCKGFEVCGGERLQW